MLDPRLLPDLDTMKAEMDSYEVLRQLSEHLDETMPDDVVNSMMFGDDQE